MIKIAVLPVLVWIIIEKEDSSLNSTETVSPKVLRRTFDTNFFGMVELTQKLLPLIKKSDSKAAY